MLVYEAACAERADRRKLGCGIHNTQIKHLRKVATPSIFSEKSIFAKQQVCMSVKVRTILQSCSIEKNRVMSPLVNCEMIQIIPITSSAGICPSVYRFCPRSLQNQPQTIYGS